MPYGTQCSQFSYIYASISNSLLFSLLQKGVYDARHSLFVITTLFSSYTKSLIYPHNDPGDIPWASSLVLLERRSPSLQANTANSQQQQFWFPIQSWVNTLPVNNRLQYVHDTAIISKALEMSHLHISLSEFKVFVPAARVRHTRTTVSVDKGRRIERWVNGMWVNGTGRQRW